MDIPLTCCTATELDSSEQERIGLLAAGHRADDAAFAQWAAGYGVITHDPLTQARVHDEMCIEVDNKRQTVQKTGVSVFLIAQLMVRLSLRRLQLDVFAVPFAAQL